MPLFSLSIHSVFLRNKVIKEGCFLKEEVLLKNNLSINIIITRDTN